MRSTQFDKPVSFSESGVMRRVLIVDDEASVRSTLRAVLETQGYICEEAENGALALSALERERFDLVITDNRMPVLNGVEFLETLAERATIDPKPPVIFFTGDIDQEETERALKAGAKAVLRKPPNFGEIIHAVQQALSE